jgi:ribosomal protein L11 methyltransferase
MNKIWQKVTIKITGVEPDEAAGLIAYDFNLAVAVDKSGITLWVDKTKSDEITPEKVVEAVIRAFSGAKADIVSVETVEEEKWLDWQKESIGPIATGDRLWIIPSWREDETPEGRTAVVIDPGLAFGTGHHPTTCGCLVMIEKLGGASTLDVGCGTGLLAIASVMLGASRAVGVDTDPDAVDVARKNVAINSVTDQVTIIEGSVDAVDEKFDTVVANLYLGPLVSLAPKLAERLNPNGVLIISGFTEDQESKVDKAMRLAGVAPLDRWTKGGWVTLGYKRG